MAIATRSTDASTMPNVRNRSFCLSFVRFLCSNIGLVLIVAAYCIGGAYLFILLEEYIELQNCQKGSLLEEVSADNISETLYSYVLLSKDNDTTIYEYVETHLENFTSEIYDRRTEYRYSGQDCSTSTGWTFPSAVLFTISVVAAIGFGHVTPTSWEGQITCICYSLIGIPLFLVCLANISSVLGDIFRFVYSSILHAFCCICRFYSHHRNGGQKRRRSREIESVSKIAYVGNRSIDPAWPEANDERLTDDESDREGKYYSQNDDIDDNHDEDENGDDAWNRIEHRVPTFLVICIIIGYLCLGGVMFQRFENWTMTQSVYFSYITLSTVGFGDFVPGITSGSVSGPRFIAASIYIVVGLAILAMCFDLLKETMVDRVQWIAHATGFIAEDDDQIDHDQTQYANFEYSEDTNDTRNHVFSANRIRPSTESPPAYDFAMKNEVWSNESSNKTNIEYFQEHY